MLAVPIALLALAAMSATEHAPPSLAGAAAARARAAERFAAGDLDAARAACDVVLRRRGDDEIACRLMMAAAALATQREAEVPALLEPARGRLGVLEPYGSLLLGRALAGLGDKRAPAILDAASAADPDGPLARAAEVPAALALAHDGQLEDAMRRLQRLLAARRGDPAALRLALADASAAAGRAEEAAALYLAVWRDHPGTEAALVAANRRAQLAQEGAAVAPPSIADHLARAGGLLDRGLADEALAELELASTPALEAALLRGRALAALQRREEADAALAACTEAAAPEALAGEALQLRARIAMRAGEVEPAVALLDRVRGPARAEAEFLAAFFEYDAGRFKAAEDRFRRFLGEQSRSGRRDEAAWYVGWTLYKQGRFEQAARELASLDARFPRSDLVPQARYWRARSLARTGRAHAARADLMLVARTWPASWYGQLARQQLGDGAPPLVLGVQRVATPASYTPQADAARGRLERAAALYAAGLGDLAGDELAAALGRTRNRDLLAAAGALALAARDHGKAMRIAVDRMGGLSGAADLAYPEAFPHEVERAARAFAIEPDLVWSIMRRESGFRPRVHSAAAAVGLMQLRPSTAAKIASVLGLDRASASNLEDPLVNVTLGTWYLAELAGRAGGSYVLAAASYNAGPEAVSRWLQDPLRQGLPLDELVDSIPYRETRGYVKAVITDVQVYRALRGAPPLQLLDEVPQLADGASF